MTHLKHRKGKGSAFFPVRTPTIMPFEEKGYRNATRQGKLAPSFNYIPTSYLIANASWSLQVWIVKIKVPVLDSRFVLKICSADTDSETTEPHRTGTIIKHLGTYSDNIFSKSNNTSHFFTYSIHYNISKIGTS